MSESTVKWRITQFGPESNLRIEIFDSDIITAEFVHQFPKIANTKIPCKGESCV